MKSIELFAGIGGLGMGISRAGFEQQLAIERDIPCCNTLRFNQQNNVEDLRGWRIERTDVANFSFEEYQGKIDLVSGGPPCQPFSLGGKQLGDLDQRDSFPLAINVIRSVRPKAFIFENVRGLSTKLFLNYFEYIKLQLSFPEVVRKSNESWANHFSRLEKIYVRGRYRGLGYRVLAQVLNAADYGIPQRRERVFIVGINNELHTDWHFPIPTHSADSLLWSKLNGEYWDIHKIASLNRIMSEQNRKRASELKSKPAELPWLTVRDSFSGLPRPDQAPDTSVRFRNHIFQPGARSYHGHTGSLMDEPSKTIKAGIHGVPGGENAILQDNGTLRYFTIRESARLQGFPDDFIFDCSWGQAMRQLGNAVPIPLAEVLAQSLKKSIISAK
ncbi:DNA cytosine methyltransferase [Dyadobacter sp. 22481]|uniref:DNA cytosine methyltransferase n=1 Tax=Dyadobacter sp. 22481 TaxID=3453926 RepID=UPI003F8488CE